MLAPHCQSLRHLERPNLIPLDHGEELKRRQQPLESLFATLRGGAL